MMNFLLRVMRFLVGILVIRARADGDVRLIGGESEFEGRVELFQEGKWGTICDDGWDITDAHVVCQQLGLGYAVSAYGGGTFGRGSGPIAMDEVRCVGDEGRLDQCSFRGWFLHDCVHQEDAGVRCSSEDGGLRLIGGTDLLEGTVEVFFGGTWGTVCDAGWDINDATVVCRSLGFMSAEAAVVSAYYGHGTGDILLSNVGCTGSEEELRECNIEYAIEHNCSHSNDAGVRCTATEVTPSSDHNVCNNYDVRIVKGTMQSGGLVEVCYKGLWGTVCASSWRKEGAFVTCRQLGYDTLETFYSRVPTEDSSPQIVRDLLCNGNETSVSECAITFGSPENCSFVAALNCSVKVFNPECNDGEVRLADGIHDHNGRAQICERGHWINLCASMWNDKKSLVICRQLGYDEADSFNVFDHLGNSKGNITSSISCSGKETVISECSFTFNEINSCVQTVNVTCEVADSGTPEEPKSIIAIITGGGTVSITTFLVVAGIAWSCLRRGNENDSKNVTS